MKNLTYARFLIAIRKIKGSNDIVAIINNTGIISKAKAEVSLPFLFWFNKLFSLFWGFWKYCVPWLKYRYKTIKWLLFDDSFMNERFLRFKRKGISNIPYPHPNKVFRVFPFLTSTFTSYLHVFSYLFLRVF